MLHLAWLRVEQSAILLLILLVSAACHKDESIGLYSRGYTVDLSSVLGIVDSDLPLFLAESYGDYIVSLSELGDLVATSDITTPPTDEPTGDEVLVPTSRSFIFPYSVSFRCVGAPCEGVVLTGRAELIIDLDEKSINLKSMDVISDDKMFHLAASVKRSISGLSSPELVSGSFTVKNTDIYELSKSVSFSIVDEYTEETLTAKVIPESEMRIDTEAGFYLTGFGM